MNFKDVSKMDVFNVFLNKDEFADTHIIDGKSMTIIIDGNEMIEREKKLRNADEKGIIQKQFLFFVASKEYGKLPAPGTSVVIDGGRYMIVDAIREGNIYSITVKATKS